MSSTPQSADPSPWAFVKHHFRYTKQPWADVSAIKLGRPLVYLASIINAARRKGSGAIVNYGRLKVQGPAPADTPTQKQKIIGLHPSLKEVLPAMLGDPKHEVVVIFEIRFGSEQLMYSSAYGFPYPAKDPQPAPAISQPVADAAQCSSSESESDSSKPSSSQ